MTHVGADYEEFMLKKKMSEISVPTEDSDIMKLLRKIGQPICLFGEDLQDRRERLKRHLAQGVASDITDETKDESEFLSKIDHGGDELIQMKKYLINFSVPRAQQRMKAERQIDQDRINETNEKGSIFKNYLVTACDHADRRPLSSIDYLNDNLLIGSLSGDISLWRLSSFSKLCEFTGHTNKVIESLFLNDQIIVSASTDKTIRFWKSPEEASCIAMPSEITSLAIHPSKNFLVAGLIDGTLNVIDIERESVIVSMKSNDGSVATVSSHTDGGLVFCGGSDHIGKLWDLRSCHAIKTMQSHLRGITCSSFDTGFHCITGSEDNTAIVWDLRNLTRSKKIAAHNSPVTSVSIKGDLLLTSSLDRTLKVWSLLDFRLYSHMLANNIPIIRAKFVDDESNNIISAGKDGMWRLFSKPLSF